VKFADQIKSAQLTMEQIETYSEGVLTVGKLKKHSAGVRDLSPEDAQLLNRIIAAHRMGMERTKVVVFEAVRAVKSQS